MPSLLESVTALLSEDGVFTKLGSIVGGDADEATSAAAGAAIPALIAGLAQRAADDDGSVAVSEMLDGADVSVVDDVSTFLDAGDDVPGVGLLDGIFGDDRSDLVSRVAANVAVDGSEIATLLPMLAPLVVGMVARRRTEQNLDADGVALLLATESEALDGDGLLDAIGDFFGSAHGTTGAAAGLTGVAATLGAKTGNAVDKASEPGGNGAAAVGGPAGGAKESPSAKRGGAKEAPAGGASATVDDDRNGGLGWLWWALGAVVLVLLLAWALSMCGEEEVVDAGGGADRSSDESLSGDSSDDDADGTHDDDAGGDDADDDAMADDADDDATADEGIQAAVDTALAGSGVMATVTGGVVTLTGTVADGIARADAIAAVQAVDGVSSVEEQIEVEVAVTEAESESESESEDGSDGGDEPDSGETINEVLDLDPVTFRISSARPTESGAAVLDEAAAFLEANPGVRVEIGGHTDDDGSADENLDLSRRRADSVRDYLVSKGIDGDRLETKGYGEAEPKVQNDSLAAKAENRRIEFTIL